MSLLTKIGSSLALYLICLVAISCTPGDEKKPQASSPVTFVQLSQLITEIGRYQGKAVQTEGLYVSGFEESAIYALDSVADKTPGKYRQIALPGLWIEFEIDWTRPKSEIVKTLPKSNTIITIQGILDTTNKGHIQQYAAALENARLISPEE